MPEPVVCVDGSDSFHRPLEQPLTGLPHASFRRSQDRLDLTQVQLYRRRVKAGCVPGMLWAGTLSSTTRFPGANMDPSTGRT